jgi:cytochrome o ubiquinol oxidase subunit 2
MTASAWPAGVLDPQGPVAVAERSILFNATAVMLAVVVPVIVLTLVFAWWYRAGNARAKRRPGFSYSGAVEVTVWAIPLLVVLFLAGIAWLGTHRLDPWLPLDAPGKPLEIQVVSLDWKWLFIQPEAGVATVNRLVVPAGVPLRLRLSSASVMNSFFVPQLGSQIYTMAGMVSQLHLLADAPGTFPGLSAQFSGEGFSDMRFEVVALSVADFAAWQANARKAPARLDAQALDLLWRPGTAVATAAFGSVEDGLFQRVLQRAVQRAVLARGADVTARTPADLAAVCRAPSTALAKAPLASARSD